MFLFFVFFLLLLQKNEFGNILIVLLTLNFDVNQNIFQYEEHNETCFGAFQVVFKKTK